MSKSDDDVDDDDDALRRSRRRRQNREAARRCRQRRKDLSANLLKEYQELQSTNTRLLHDVRVLDKERQQLDDCLNRHIGSCQRQSSVISDPLLLSSSSSSRGRPTGESCSAAKSRPTSEPSLAVDDLTMPKKSATGFRDTVDRSKNASEVLNRPSSANSTGNSTS